LAFAFAFFHSSGLWAFCFCFLDFGHCDYDDDETTIMTMKFDDTTYHASWMTLFCVLSRKGT